MAIQRLGLVVSRLIQDKPIMILLISSVAESISFLKKFVMRAALMANAQAAMVLNTTNKKHHENGMRNENFAMRHDQDHFVKTRPKLYNRCGIST